MSAEYPVPTSLWSPLVSDATWLPHIYDPRADTLQFAQVSREARGQAVFLDPRYIRARDLSSPVPLADLDGAEVAAAAGPLHFIFHTSFCCSTLLTRALDQPGISMGLKEPSVFVAFARLKAKGRDTAGAIGGLSTTLDLLSRPLEPGETQVIKPSNFYNALIPQMMHLRGDAKAVLLYSPLEAFLRAIARRGLEGRIYARELYQSLSTAMSLDIDVSREDLALQTDMQIAAQAWLMQIAFFKGLAARYGPSRVRTLDSDTFLADPALTLTKLAAFIGLPMGANACAEIAAGAIFREHAKQPGTAFDAAAQKAQFDKSAEGNARELARAKEWALAVAQRFHVPQTLGDTLITTP